MFVNWQTTTLHSSAIMMEQHEQTHEEVMYVGHDPEMAIKVLRKMLYCIWDIGFIL